MGINFHVHWTLRTIRTRIKAAKKARQNASNNPLDSAGHWSKIGAFAKKPLVLHINAAAMMSNRPRHNGDKYVDSVALSAEGIIEEDPRKSRMTYGKDSRINRAAVFSTQTENGALLLMIRGTQFSPVPESVKSQVYQIAEGTRLVTAQQRTNVKQIKKESSGSSLTKAATPNRLRSITSCDVEFWLAYVVFCGLTCDDPYRSFWFPLE